MKPISIYSIVVATFLTFALFVSYTEDDRQTTEPTTPATADLPQLIKAISLNKTFDFGGEVLPTHENFDYHSNTILNIKKAARFFPIIEPILAKHGVPDDMKYLAVAESDLRNATSPAGAKGIWQFMKATGKAAGLEINSGIDLGDFAIQNGTTYRMIKLLNPWLLTSSLPNSSGRTYQVKIPRR